ncbi:3,4-dihydroxy-5-hexaprenylbenzoate methyltransferase [Cavenderia fasciculata]|uniref:Ubiquinone biosynthesis O-methyltransferase, mitochondrial n=1 Tax=Cavenderia fasciculata TaxID=261658 RepID=F4PUY8_CACFS|nr:3,4-dihydroxy-5-hexaprenylbenzoate methyltransferase [Cavenderia fasciculata]EGG21950.1 3,4-dihydroxy-5-hexaprenylbenzoate methyltransferase [Cavenderia fasciculata]|eukprot:XP_004359801.1 3,4-dihydroxy-5-hexaprenylbenzoate methyltransferase [Cavenderia fasciculata]
MQSLSKFKSIAITCVGNRYIGRCALNTTISNSTSSISTTNNNYYYNINRSFSTTPNNHTTNTNNNNNNSQVGSSSTSSSSSSKRQNEIDFFNTMAKDWWNEEGEMKPLHKMNPVRVQYIVEKLKEVGAINGGGGGGDVATAAAAASSPLKGLKIIDVGCGAGLLTESLCRLGASVVGVDAAQQNIKMAIAHANLDQLLQQKLQLQQLEYIESTIENHVVNANNPQYDVVCSLEVVEHVDNVPEFISNLTKILKPGGSLFISTINRTPLSWLLTIVGAEYLLRIVPVNTHHHNQFVMPTELRQYIESSDSAMRLLDQKGLFYNPITCNWSIMDDTKVNYIIHAIKLK